MNFMECEIFSMVSKNCNYWVCSSAFTFFLWWGLRYSKKFLYNIVIYVGSVKKCCVLDSKHRLFSLNSIQFSKTSYCI